MVSSSPSSRPSRTGRTRRPGRRAPSPASARRLPGLSFLCRVLRAFWSFQTAGSSSSWLTCSSFSDFRSKSKIPPKFGFATGQVVQQGGEGVDAFSFHGLERVFLGLNRTLDYTRSGYGIQAHETPPPCRAPCRSYDRPLSPTILSSCPESHAPHVVYRSCLALIPALVSPPPCRKPPRPAPRPPWPCSRPPTCTERAGLRLFQAGRRPSVGLDRTATLIAQARAISRTRCCSITATPSRARRWATTRPW
jgi:hypothetical protein